MANILIDEGSQRTFITKETIEKLNIYSNECATENTAWQRLEQIAQTREVYLLPRSNCRH